MATSLLAIWNDLHRRRVFRVGALYAAVSWVIVQVVAQFAPPLFLPDWVVTATVVLVILGFPVAVVLAWLFDVGPKGVVRTKPGSATGIVAILVSVGLLVGGTAAFVALVVPRPDARTEEDTATFTPIANSIAVLPFLDLSDGQNFEHFTDGIAEVLIHQLSQFDDLHVIARTSSFSFKGKQADVRSIGRLLGVGKILEGSVQRAGGKLRISAQLIDTQTGAHIWSKLFDRDEQDIFDIQDEIAIAIATSMPISISDEAKAAITGEITDSLDAYDLYLIARHEYAKQNYVKAIAVAKDAIALDADFALAMAALADSYIKAGEAAVLPWDESMVGARSAIDAALEIAPDLGAAHASNIFWAYYAGDVGGALTSFERAVELDANYIWSYVWVAKAYFFAGQLRAAERVLQHARKLDPLDPYIVLSLFEVSVSRGDYYESVNLIMEATGLEMRAFGTKNFVHNLAFVSQAFARYDTAVAYGEIFPPFDPPNMQGVLAQIWGNTELGRFDEARRLIDEFGAVIDSPHMLFDHIVFDYKVFSGDIDALRDYAEYLDAAARREDSKFKGIFSDLAARANVYLGNWSAALDNYAGSNSYGEYVFARAVTMAFLEKKVGGDAAAGDAIEEAVREYDRFWREGYSHPYILAWSAELMIVRDDADAAIQLLRQAYDLGFRNYFYLKYWPLYDALRGDERFINLMKSMRYDLEKMRQRITETEETGDWELLLEVDLTDVLKAEVKT